MSRISLALAPVAPALFVHPSRLGAVFNLLTTEGWQDTVLQLVFPGQRYGLVIPGESGTEFHMRAYWNGRLDAHWELSRDFIQHLWWPSVDATGYLEDVLARWRIPCQVVGRPQRPASYSLPASMTPWKPVAIVAAFFGLIAIAANGGEGSHSQV